MNLHTFRVIKYWFSASNVTHTLRRHGDPASSTDRSRSLRTGKVGNPQPVDCRRCASASRTSRPKPPSRNWVGASATSSRSSQVAPSAPSCRSSGKAESVCTTTGASFRSRRSASADTGLTPIPSIRPWTRLPIGNRQADGVDGSRLDCARPDPCGGDSSGCKRGSLCQTDCWNWTFCGR